MERLDTLFWIISIILSAVSLCAMLFGVRLGKRALTKNFTLYGEQAVQRLAFLKENTLKGLMPASYIYGGGNLTTPQLKVEKIIFDPQTMPRDWRGYSRSFQFYDRDKKNSGDILVEEWRV